MSELYVKICGLKTPDSVTASIEAGANALGFIFAPGSARTIHATDAARLIENVPEGVETVGVFRNQPVDHVLEMATESGVTTIQLHGDEPYRDLKTCEAAGFKTFKAFSAFDYAHLGPDAKHDFRDERILLDAVEPGAGLTFDAGVLQGNFPVGFWLLAGGLTPQNVGSLIRELSPTGVDVSSGVESSRGVKDSDKIRAFITAAREAN